MINLEQLHTTTRDTWYQLSHNNYNTLEKIDFWHQYRAEVNIDHLTHMLFRHITHYHKAHHGEWVSKATEMMMSINQIASDYWFIEMTNRQQQNLVNQCINFYQRAKHDFPSLKLPSLFIGISHTIMLKYMSLLFNIKPYSLDANYACSTILVQLHAFLASETENVETKKRLLHRLRQRLNDQQLAPSHMFEIDCWKMVTLIEETLDEDTLAKLFEALEAFILATIEGLLLTNSDNPYDQDILSTTISIGGTQGLIGFSLFKQPQMEERYLFFYQMGFLHELIIHLFQNASRRKQRHSIFAISKGHYELDPLVNKMLHLVDLLLASYIKDNQYLAVQMKHHYSWLILYFAMNNKKALSKSYRKYIADYLHVPSKFYVSYHRYVSRKYKRLKSEYHKTKTEDIIGYLLR